VTANAAVALVDEAVIPEFQVYGLSHPGAVRGENEDTWLGDPETGLVLVADGVGGHGDGAWASHEAAEGIARFVRRVHSRQSIDKVLDPDFQARVVGKAIGYAHRRMLAARARGAHHRCGSTIVGVWAPGGANAGATLFHVGDSRLYLLRQQRFLQLTKDHSAYEQWRMQGEIGSPPSRKYILQALGLTDRVEPTVQTIVPVPGDKILICSDGLTGAVEDEDLASILASDGGLSMICETLIATGLSHEADDNLTAVVCGF
jgi:protein phosphatase